MLFSVRVARNTYCTTKSATSTNFSMWLAIAVNTNTFLHSMRWPFHKAKSNVSFSDFFETGFANKVEVCELNGRRSPLTAFSHNVILAFRTPSLIIITIRHKKSKLTSTIEMVTNEGGRLPSMTTAFNPSFVVTRFFPAQNGTSETDG